MKHFSLSVYDQDYLKVCDLFDSGSQAQGQAYNIYYTEELNTGWKEITFDLPFLIEKENNFRWNYVRNEYLLRVRRDDIEDWFFLQAPSKKKNGKAVTNNVRCVHVSAGLKTKNIYFVFDDENGIGTIDYLMGQVLTNTTWGLGTCDKFYERDGTTEKVRSISSDDKRGAYQLIQDICNLFNAYPVFNGATRTVDIHALDNKLPLTEMYVGKNLNSLTVEINSESIVTRLYVEGEYGDDGYVGIDEYNDDLPFLLNFDYYKQIGLFKARHQIALDKYLSEVKNVRGEIKDAMALQLEQEDLLNELWGQIPYVLLCLSGGRVTKTYYGGTLLADQKEIVAGDELLVMPTSGDYRAYTVPSVGASFHSTDQYAVKFIVLPNGKVGARQVAAEAGIGDLEYKADDGLTLNSAMRQALEYAENIGDIGEEIKGMKAEQTAVEGEFADAMGDMLRDGYWSNTNYAIGQEQLLYWDALDQIVEVSKPKVKYGISLVVLSQELGYDPDEFQLNTKIHLLDTEMNINDVVYVSKRTLCLDNPKNDRVEISNDGLVSSVNSFEYVLAKMTQIADNTNQKNTVYERAKVISSQGQIGTTTIKDKSITTQKLSEEVQSLLGVNYSAQLKYSDSVLKPFDFQNKSAAFFGDGTIYGSYSNTTSVVTSQCENSWVNLFCSKLSITKDNQAALGEQASTTRSKIASYSPGTAPAFIFVGTGQSDWLAGRAIGKFGDSNDTTFYGRMEGICNALETSFSSATVIFVTPINQPLSNTDAAASLNEYRNAIFEVACAHGFNVVDGSKLGFPTGSGGFRDKMIPNGRYPSEDGYYMMYKTICGVLL